MTTASLAIRAAGKELGMNRSQGLTWRTAVAGLVAVAMAGLACTPARAAVIITGTTGAKFLLTGSPITTTTHSNLKISFGDNTPGTNLELCAGTGADFSAGTCAIRLSDSGGPGFVFLTIIDAATLNGMQLYVLRAVGSAAAEFTLTIE